MLTPSPEIIQWLACFAPLFTQPSWTHALTLFCGAVLAPGNRTVTALLRVVGREADPHFTNFHRFLNRARWSPLALARVLFLQAVRWVPAGEPLVLVVDHTLLHRAGRHVPYKGVYRDAVRSTQARVVCAWGLRWLVVGLQVPVPWSSRRWVLPVVAVPVRSEATCRYEHRAYAGIHRWLRWLLRQIRTWVPERPLVCVGDGEFAAVRLVAACQADPSPLALVARLRWDAVLYDPPQPQPASKRGPKPKKGPRQLSLRSRLTDPGTSWQTVTVPWYGGQRRTLEYATGTALWHTSGQDPVPLRWVLVREPPPDQQGKSGKLQKPEPALTPAVFGCSDLRCSVEAILGWIVARWGIEVTFEELRAHLGWETGRHWSRTATGRSTALLAGVFTATVLLADHLYPKGLPHREAAWYEKSEATFSDVLAAVRAHLWRPENYGGSSSDVESCLIPQPLLAALRHAACYAP